MNNAHLYVKSNICGRNISQRTLIKYKHLLKFDGENDLVLDIGCGPGRTTWEVLKPFLPSSARIVGADIQQEMLEYAKKCYPEMAYIQLDITTKDLSNKLFQNFSHIFSFFCFHRFDNLRQAYLNTYKMLKSGGHLTMCFLVSHDMYFIYDHLAIHSKWDNLKVINYIPRYHYFVNDQDIENNLKNILEDIGFDVLAMNIDEQEYMYNDIKEFTDIMKSIDCYYLQLPKRLKEEYFHAWMQTYRKLFLRKIYNKYPEHYKIVTFCAKKPEKSSF